MFSIIFIANLKFPHHFLHNENVKQYRMSSNEIHESNWIVTLIFPQQLKCVQKNEQKLTNLKEWIKAFPPEENSPCRRKNCDGQKIRINYDMHKCIDEAEKC